MRVALESLRSSEAMAAWSSTRRAAGESIGFVPTMGYLHEGHASLMRLLRPRVDRLVVSIYVNPLQFGPNEDLDTYPRDEEGDLALCASEGVDAVFLPGDLYPDGFSTQVAVHGLTERMEGEGRPGHFEGVATVCTRLFHLVQCNEAAFGEKDYQQLMMMRRLVTDLAMPVRIVPGPVARADDGLALSSRNAYLSADQRRRAPSLNAALRWIAAQVDAGRTDVSGLIEEGRARIDCDRLAYLEITDAETLAPLTVVGDCPARAIATAYYGATRLLDNVAVGAELSWT